MLFKLWQVKFYIYKPQHGWQFWYQHIINSNFASLKGPITTFTIIFEPLRVPIVITSKNIHANVESSKDADLRDNNVTYYLWPFLGNNCNN